MAEIKFMPRAKKYFKKLKDERLKKLYRNAIDLIAENPYIGNPKTGDLKGLYGYDIFYNKTNYELAYIIEVMEDGEIVVIVMAGTRENFYDEIKRYLK